MRYFTPLGVSLCSIAYLIVFAFCFPTSKSFAQVEGTPVPYGIEDPNETESTPTPTSTPPEATPSPSPTDPPPSTPMPTPTPEECPPGTHLECSSHTELSQLGVEESECVCEPNEHSECELFQFTFGATWSQSESGRNIFDFDILNEIPCLAAIAESCRSDLTIEFGVPYSDDCIATKLSSPIELYRLDRQLAIQTRINELREEYLQSNQTICNEQCTQQCESTCRRYQGAPGNSQGICENMCDSNCRSRCLNSGYGAGDPTLLQEIDDLFYELRQIQQEAIRNSVFDGQFAIDRECGVHEINDPREVCHERGTVGPSPISLLWENTDINASISVSKFQLNPYKSGRWYTWKGSEQAPLLVYDPNRERVVHSAKQLFGNWTFGGKDYSALMSRESTVDQEISSFWRDGYEALSVLDTDENGKVDGVELDSLALWFDKNRDGTSQSGEVLGLQEMGVTALYYTPDTRDPVTKDIYVTKGYERIVNGKTIVGTSVDWFGTESASKLEAVAKLSMMGMHTGVSASTRFYPNPLLLESSETNSISKRADSLVIEEDNISGLWHWEPSEDTESTMSFGMLHFIDTGTEFSGISAIETPLQANPRHFKSLLNKYRVEGKKYIESDGKVRILFKTIGHGSHTKSVAYLSKDKNMLLGRSETVFPNVSSKNGKTVYRYSWKARRM